MFEASAAGAQTGAIEHWMCSHCSAMRMEEATPTPEQAPAPKPELMEVEEGDHETEPSPEGALYANDRGQNIDHMEDVISLSPATQAQAQAQATFTPLSSPLPTAGPTNPTYETPLYLLSFQKQAHFIPEQRALEPSLPLLTSLFPSSKSPSDYEGVFTPRGGRSRAQGLLKHLCQ